MLNCEASLEILHTYWGMYTHVSCDTCTESIVSDVCTHAWSMCTSTTAEYTHNGRAPTAV